VKTDAASSRETVPSRSPAALGHDLRRELVEPVFDRRVEVPDGFEQAERNDGRDGGRRGGAGGTRQGGLRT
jgi:hypothetical protein